MKRLTILLIYFWGLINFQLSAQKILFQENFDDNRNEWQNYKTEKLQIRNGELVLEGSTGNPFENPKVEKAFKVDAQINFSLKSKIRFLGNNQLENIKLSFGSVQDNPFGNKFYQKSISLGKNGVLLGENALPSGKNPFKQNNAKSGNPFANNPFAKENTPPSNPSIETNQEDTYILEFLRIGNKIFTYVNEVCVAWKPVGNMNFEKIYFQVGANSKVGVDYVNITQIPQNYFNKQIVKEKGKYVGKIRTLAYELPPNYKQGFLAYIDGLEEGQIIAVKDPKSKNAVAVSVVGKLLKFNQDYAQDGFELRLTQEAMQRIGKTNLMPVEIEYNTEIGVWLFDLTVAKDSNKVHTYHKLYNAYKNIDNQKALYYLNQALNYAKAIRFYNGIASSYQLLADFNISENFQKPYHTVGRGETLYSIATAHNLDVYTLQKINNLKDLSIGSEQVLQVSQTISPQIKEIESYYLKALEAQKKGKDPHKLAVRYKLTGDFYADKLGRTKKAKAYYQKWLEIREKQENPTHLMWAYRFWGKLEQEHGNIKKTIEFFEKYLKVSKDNDTREKYYERVFYVGTYFMNIFEPKIAIEYFEQVFTYKKNTGKNYATIQHHIRVAYIGQVNRYRNTKNLIKATEVCEKLVAKFELFEDVQSLMRLYKEQKKYDKYLSSIKKYLNKQVQTVPNLSTYSFYEATELSRLFSDKESLDMSIEFMEKWLTELKNPKYLRLRLAILGQLRIAHQNYTKDFGKAGTYALEIHHLNTPKDTFGLVNSLDDIAFLYQKDENYSESLKYFNQALEVRTKQGNPILMAEQLNKLGYLYEVQQSKKAKKYYKKSLKLCQQTEYDKTQFTNSWQDVGNIHAVFTQFERIIQSYQKQGDAKFASKYEQNYQKLKDKLTVKHIVQPYEDLWNISKKYGVGMQHLRHWNKLSSNIIVPEQEIIIIAPTKKPTTSEAPPTPPKSSTNPLNPNPFGNNNTVPNPFGNNNTVPNPQTNLPKPPSVKLRGFAEQITGVSSTGRFVAFANNIRQGTLITVKSISSGEAVSAVVVSALPENTDKTVTIQLSPEAFKRLKTDEAQIPVEISYE